ncbi:GNAT family N-acetyltransferase [Maritalea porphyrae]|uniref:N-acetyltransferase GCN5 n=1 Tax=Maritalea porphyrae TaxID=880732 RepID=A0ABQ5UT08_9HYPH|nr:GNAT family N-acetyltransferase [Maritalea porphyrae]GLQ17511.1 N-acetyltransferase GCN5 [Maritalea porphyrae]
MTFNTIYRALPLRFLTDTLELRPIELADLADLVQLANNKKLADVLARLPHPYTSEDGLYFINDHANGTDERVWAICKRKGPMMGVVGIAQNADGQGELGYWLGEEFWGQGIGSQAIGALMDEFDIAVPELELHARCLKSNLASKALLEKVGFEVTGEQVGCGQHDGADVWTFTRPARDAGYLQEAAE